MSFKRYAIAGALVLVLAGCGQSKETVSDIPEDEPTKVSVAARDAEGVVTALTEAGLPIGGIVVLTEETDDNNMMGRPGGYTSKVFFFDNRYEGEGMEPSEQNTIEVFPSEEDATRRREYIEGVTEGMPMFSQYRIQVGLVLMRLDKVMKPGEAKEYEAALGEL